MLRIWLIINFIFIESFFYYEELNSLNKNCYVYVLFVYSKYEVVKCLILE